MERIEKIEATRATRNCMIEEQIINKLRGLANRLDLEITILDRGSDIAVVCPDATKINCVAELGEFSASMGVTKLGDAIQLIVYRLYKLDEFIKEYERAQVEETAAMMAVVDSIK